MTEHTPHLRARLDRTQIDTQQNTTAFLVVEVTAPEVAEQTPRPNQPLNLALVIDASGSMADSTTDDQEGEEETSRLAAAQRAACGIIERLDSADILSVVSFADDTLTHIAAMRMSGGGKEAAMDAIGSLSTRGCTDLNGGWLKGAEHVARHMAQHPGTRNRVLLLSDGHANGGVTEPDLLADTAVGLRNRGIFTSTVGIGLDYSTAQLEVLAEHGGGMMHHAEHAEDIVAVILAELNDMRSSILDDVAVVLSQVGDEATDDAGNGSPVLDISAVGYDAQNNDGVITTSVGSLVSGACRRVVFRLHLPPARSRSQATFTVTVSWRDDGGDMCTSDAQQIVLRIDPAHSLARDREVALLAAQAWLDETIRRAMVMNRAEHFGEIRAWAKQEMASFRHYCQRLPTGEELIHRMNRLFSRTLRPMPERSRKEISLSRLKGLRSSADHRVAMSPRGWDSYLDEE